MINNDIISGFDDEKNGNLKIKLQKVPDVEDCLIITLNGYIDTYNSNYFQKMVNKTIAAKYVNLIFNCGELSYVSSTGIGSFAMFQKTVKPKGGNIVLFDVQTKVFEVFQLLGFPKFFHFEDNLEGSINFFCSVPMERGSIFPISITCPICSKQLNVTKPGRVRCFGCNTAFTIDNSGKTLLAHESTTAL